MKRFRFSVGIIDDDDLYRAILAKVFQRSGLALVFQARNGKSGLEQMTACHPLPSVVVIDVEMPIMNGFDTARGIKANWPQVGIIAHSSLNDQTTRDQMIHFGADLFLPKEEGIKALLSTIEDLSTLKRNKIT